MNCNILKDDNFRTKFKVLVQETITEYEEVPKRMVWEIIRVKELTIQYSVKTAKDRTLRKRKCRGK